MHHLRERAGAGAGAVRANWRRSAPTRASRRRCCGPARCGAGRCLRPASATRGLAEVAAGLADQSSSHNALLRPYYLQTARRPAAAVEPRLDEADALLETARAVGRDTDQQMFAAEWHRLRGADPAGAGSRQPRRGAGGVRRRARACARVAGRRELPRRIGAAARPKTLRLAGVRYSSSDTGFQSAFGKTRRPERRGVERRRARRRG